MARGTIPSAEAGPTGIPHFVNRAGRRTVFRPLCPAARLRMMGGAMIRRDRLNRWLRGLAVVLAVLALLAFAACRVIGSVFRAKLAELVRRDLNAELATGSVIYRPPFTFVARDVRVTRRDASGQITELLRAGKLWVKLDGIPHQGKPLPLRFVALESAELRPPVGTFPMAQLELSLHSASTGVYACDLTMNDGPAASGAAKATVDVNRHVCAVETVLLHGHLGAFLGEMPLSHPNRLRLDEIAPEADITVLGSGEVPLQDPRRATYQVTVDVANGAAKIKDVRRSFTKGNGRIVLRNGPVAEGAPAQAVLEHFEICAGSAQVDLGGGKLSVWPDRKAWKLAEVVGSIRMGSELPLGLERSGWFFEQADFRGPVDFTAAASGPTHLPHDNPLDAIQHEVLAYPHGLSLQPRTWPEPVRDVTGGPIAFRGGVVTFQNLSGRCGRDKLLLRRARLTLWDPARKIRLDDLRTQIKFEELAGTVIFQRPVTRYPSALGRTIEALRPAGSFIIGGGSWYAMNRPLKENLGRQLKPEYFIRLMGEGGGSFVVSKYDIPLNEIHGEATIAPLQVDITQFEANAVGGTAYAKGRITPGKPFLYEGDAEVRDIDLRRLAAVLNLGEPARSRLSGIGYCTAHLTGAGAGGAHTPAAVLTADGEAQVLRGDFWTVPPVGVVAEQVRRQEQLGIGDAAAVFHIADQVITLKSAALSAPMIGLQGMGTIGFDRSLFLMIVVAPLGDWRDQMRQAGIPLVGDVLGAIQQFLNTVKGTLFYQFRVTGTLGRPVKSLIPAPALTDPNALLFGQMMREGRNGQLLNDVRAAAGAPATQPAGQGKR